MANDIDAWVQLTFGVDPATFPPRSGQTGAKAPASGSTASPAPHPADAGADGAASRGVQLGLADGAGKPQPGSVEALGPSDVLDALKVLAGATGRTAAVTVRNDTGDALTLAGQPDMPWGSLETPPPPKINPNTKEDFSAKNTTVLGLASAGVEGTVKYKIGDSGPTLIIHFDNPLFKKNNADAKIDGQNPDSKYSATAFAATGNDAKFTFALEAKGGGKPDPGPGPQPGQDANASCQITVNNNTKLVLNLAHQGHDFGDFMSFPASAIQPGASTTCISTHTPHAKDGQQGCKGFLVWEAQAAGGATAVTWRVDWTNPVGAKNDASATIDPQSAGFKSLEQMGQGDENVPVAFTLSGGGDGPGPQPGGATSCEISISNSTALLLRLSNQKHTPGDFTGAPANEIKPGGAITCADGGPQGCAGSLVYSIVQPGDGTTQETAVGTWTMQWNNPPGESNEADAHVDPANNGLQSFANVGPGDSKVAVSFSLFGELKLQPPPPPPQQPFQMPPTKTRQPTLREGDESADGWVEYAQELLQLPPNGKFDAAMKKAVEKFQGDNKLQVDGTIGNQTWAALRKGAAEKPSTDGRKPHSFVQEGEQARFMREKYTCGYVPAHDALVYNLVSVGTDTKLDDEKFMTRITAPSGKQSTLQLPFGPVIQATPDGQGNIYAPFIKDFLKTYGADSPGATGDQFLIEAYLDTQLGGDSFSDHPVIVNQP